MSQSTRYIDAITHFGFQQTPLSLEWFDKKIAKTHFMGKVILSMMMSLDGYIEGPNGDINWHVWNEEMSDYMMDLIKTVDTFIYGRKSYELMLTYWPFETGKFAEIMNRTPKIVFSKTLDKVEWNSRLIKQNVIEEIQLAKGNSAKDLVLFAGANIASTFMKNDLIDEFRLMINPVVLGEGTLLFQARNQIELELLESRAFVCGNTLLRYSYKTEI